MVFSFLRSLQIVTLLPTLGMLAYIVDPFHKQRLITPKSILIHFVVSVLVAAWTIPTFDCCLPFHL